MSELEKYYDAEIAPALLEIANKCKEHGMNLVASVEFEPNITGRTYQLSKDAGLAMWLLYICAESDINVDKFILSVKYYCRKNNINTDSSVYLSDKFSNP